jgi:hypothetical protein
MTFNDDRLRVQDHQLDEARYWEKIRDEVSHWEQPERVALVFIHGYKCQL